MNSHGKHDPCISVCLYRKITRVSTLKKSSPNFCVFMGGHQKEQEMYPGLQGLYNLNPMVSVKKNHGKNQVLDLAKAAEGFPPGCHGPITTPFGDTKDDLPNVFCREPPQRGKAMASPTLIYPRTHAYPRNSSWMCGYNLYN